MSGASRTGNGPLPLELARRVDQVCDRFEDDWVAGRRPRIEHYLGETPDPARGALLGELLRVELERRLGAGERPSREEYQARFPEQTHLVEALFRRLTSAAATPVPGSGRKTTQGPAKAGKGAAAAPLPAVPGYEVLGVLGQGGMGIVYRARQIALSRPVALKMIRPGIYAGENERSRFRAEAGAVARLQHPNVIQIYEVGEHDGRPFLALELAEGGSLADRLGGTPQPARRAAELLETLARAVHAAHQAGVIHRDLKPANILLQKQFATGAAGSADRRGDRKAGSDPAAPSPSASGASALAALSSFLPKITDFGLAKELDQEKGQTASGAILGTPSYMAPEQASGLNRAIGPAVDVYALGAILYEVLTGRPPFKAATVLDTLEQVRSQEPVHPRRLEPKVPRDLETICLKCLQKDPRRRYPNAAALDEDLRAFLDNRPIRARPISAWEQTVKWAWRRPAVAALAAAVVVVTAVAIGLVTWKWRAAVVAGQEAQDQRRLAEGLLLRKYLDQGQMWCEQGEIARGMLQLVQTLRMVPEGATDLRRAIRASLAGWRNRLHPIRLLLPHPAPVVAASFSPDGRVILTVAEDNRVRLWEAATGRPLGPPLEHPRPVLTAVFSPDGDLVLTGCADWRARLWEVATGRPFGKPLKHGGAVRTAVFNPDGRTVVTGSDDRTVRVWDVASGQLLGRGKHKGPVLAAAFSPDGKWLVTGSADGTDGAARVWQWVTAQWPWEETALRKVKDIRAEGEVLVVRFSPGGHQLVTISRDRGKRGENAVVLWGETPKPPKAPGGRFMKTLLPHFWSTAVAFSPNGQLVATASEDHTAQMWETTGGAAFGHPLPHQDTVRVVAFSPGGQALLTGGDDRAARMWDVATGRPIGQPLEHRGAVTAVGFSPDGHTLLTASTDGTVRLWEAALARPYLQEFSPRKEEGRESETQVMSVAWGPKGRTLVTGLDNEKAWRWDRATGRPLEPALAHDDDVWVAAFSPDGRTILTGSRDKTVRVWDAATGKPRHVFPFGTRVRSAAFSRDGRTFLAEGGKKDRGKVRFWDVETGRTVGPALAVPGTVWQVAVSPDGKTCAVASGENTVQLWEPAEGRVRGLPARHESRVVALAFSPDGRLLATGSTDKTARLWQVAAGEPYGDPLQHPGAVWGVAFSADGRTVVTGARDGGARLWDVATGTPIGPPWFHRGVVWAVACHPGDPLALTGSADGTARLWPIPEAVPGDQERITLWVQVMTGMDLDAGGAVHWLDGPTWQQRRRLLERLGGPPLP